MNIYSRGICMKAIHIKEPYKSKEEEERYSKTFRIPKSSRPILAATISEDVALPERAKASSRKTAPLSPMAKEDHREPA